MKTVSRNKKQLRHILNKMTPHDEMLHTDYLELLKSIYPAIKWYYTKEDGWHGDWFAIGIGLIPEHYYFAQGSFGSCSHCDKIQYFEMYWDINPINEIEEEFLDFLVEMSRIEFIEGKENFIKYLKIKNETLWGDIIEIDTIVLKDKNYKIIGG